MSQQEVDSQPEKDSRLKTEGDSTDNNNEEKPELNEEKVGSQVIDDDDGVSGNRENDDLNQASDLQPEEEKKEKVDEHSITIEKTSATTTTTTSTSMLDDTISTPISQEDQQEPKISAATAPATLKSVNDDKIETKENQDKEKKEDIMQVCVDDLTKLHIICQRYADNRPIDPKNDSILSLIVSDDLSCIKNFDVLHALFKNYLNIIPYRVLSEVLSILIATVKKSVFDLALSRGLLVPSVHHLLRTSDRLALCRATTTSTTTNTTSKQSISTNEQSISQSDLDSVSLTKHFLCEWINILISHSCDVDELKSIIELSEKDHSLLGFIQQANVKQRNQPSSFFAFPGTRGSMISLPPFQKWPVQNGWSFSAWLLLEPKACAQPYLYNIKTGKSGLGYSAHFTGNCLVLTSIRIKGKGVQHCVAYEFPSYKWIHCAITYHNKWRASEVRIYVNGQLLPSIEIAWQVQTNEIFDKCSIGGTGFLATNAIGGDRTGELNSFCGQMSAIYIFNEGLSAAQICAIHRLGPSYMGQFRYSNESQVNLPPMISKSLYEEKLATSLFCLFSPVAVDGGTLCIQLAPLRSSTTIPAQNYFISAPHAALLGQTKAITTQPIFSTIQSIGCSESLLPLLDHFASLNQTEACAFLITFLCDLLEYSPHWFANEIVQNNGFVMVSCSLARNAKQLLNDQILDIFINLSQTLITAASPIGGSLLLKHLMDNILFNPSLWIYAETHLQVKLYNYLSNEFLNGTRRTSNNKYTISSSGTPESSNSTGNSASNSSSSYIAYNPTSGGANLATQGALKDEDQSQAVIVTDILFGEIRRVSTVLQCLHALKYYYWLEEEEDINHKARNVELRPKQDELLTIRWQILLFMKELLVRSNVVPLDETQGILNYLSTCSNCKNLMDVLEILSNLLTELPSVMVPALDRKQAIKVIYHLLDSPDEEVRLKSLRLLNLYLARCTHKRKQEIMGPNNLFMLLTDKLKPHLPLTSKTYETLMDLLLERIDVEESATSHQTNDLRKMRIDKSIIIKVIGNLLTEEYNLMDLPNREEISSKNRSRFINDLWNLIVNSRENRRIILQMSVWQHWLSNLIGNTLTDSQLIRDQVLAIFRVLLYHATRYEYGGWRVWIDTLAIIHTKVSLDEFLLNHSPGLSSPSTSDAKHQNPSAVIEKKGDLNQNRDSDSEFTKETIALETTSAQGFEDKPTTDKKGVDVVGHQVSIDEEAETKSISNSELQLDASRSDSIGLGDEKEAEEDHLNDKDGPKAGSDCQSVQSDSNPISDPIPDETQDIDNIESKVVSSICDSVDLAPTRSFRKLKLTDDKQVPREDDEPASKDSEKIPESSSPNQTSENTMTSIPLDEDSDSESLSPIKADVAFRRKSSGSGLDDTESQHHDEDLSSEQVNCKIQNVEHMKRDFQSQQGQQQQKVSASPAFRIPEFKWSPLLIKLLNDLVFSIECDLYNWRCSGNCMNMDKGCFVPRTANATGESSSSSSGNQTSGSSSRNGAAGTAATTFFEQLLQRSENQIYIINIIHFISQLCDNIIIASGGLLPLLAEATGGSRANQSASDAESHDGNTGSRQPNPLPDPLKLNEINEGLLMKQSNSLLYRLTNMVDVVVLAASHINLDELESDKNGTRGCILRQCLRLACTLTVKNCLVIRSINHKLAPMDASGKIELTEVEFPKDFFDSYQGCSLLSANSLFVNSSTSSLEGSDLVANVEYSSHQTPNSSSMPSLLPFQCNPIKDGNKLLQAIDVARIQACIYLNNNLDSRESQFLALSSLYFISVLMVSKYRDIIEPKTNATTTPESSRKSNASRRTSINSAMSQKLDGDDEGGSDSTRKDTEADLLKFGKMQPTVGGSHNNNNNNNQSHHSLTDLLTARLENTLDVICPLLKTIMCDFSGFLSRTLIGSHGQDLVSKESDRAFKKSNTSPVELVMLLCSQEWQNTLQKNAGFAFIELINEGRLSSISMKEHIVRVAMEAEFILSRLRADDVSKHEQFNVCCNELLCTRLNEEMLINSLISSASRKDFSIYCKFCDGHKLRWPGSTRRNLKLDNWEDDDRRMRRFVMDSHQDQDPYVAPDREPEVSAETIAVTDTKSNTKRILDLHESHDVRQALKVHHQSKMMMTADRLDGAPNESLDAQNKMAQHLTGDMMAEAEEDDEPDEDEPDEDDEEEDEEEEDFYLDEPSSLGHGRNRARQRDHRERQQHHDDDSMAIGTDDEMDSDTMDTRCNTTNGRTNSSGGSGSRDVNDCGIPKRTSKHHEVDEQRVRSKVGAKTTTTSSGNLSVNRLRDSGASFEAGSTTAYRRHRRRAHRSGFGDTQTPTNGSSANTTPNPTGTTGNLSPTTSPNQSNLQGVHRDNHLYGTNDVANQAAGAAAAINGSEVSGTSLFGADCSLIWSIYAIPGVLSLSHNELYFEPNQNVNEILEALKKDPQAEHELKLENLIPAPDPDNLATQYQANLVYIKTSSSDDLNQMNGGGSSNEHHHHQASNGNNQRQLHSTNHNNHNNNSSTEQTYIKTYQLLNKFDLKVLRYCDFLTGNGKIALHDIRAIFSRHYLLQPHALEIFVAQRSSVMFSFLEPDTIRKMIRFLPPVGVGIKYGIPQTRRASLMSGRQLFEASNMTQKWQTREIGNFQYLMFLNTIAGRTYQDLNQYPVFPWILTNYDEPELDLNLPANFRDLSKPVGALNSKRRNEFIERYQSWDNPKVPAFHYGTHYSTAAFTLNWLCRLRGNPHQAYLALHDGKYEEESRLFKSLQDSWLSSLTSGQQNVKEVIPEFFYLPEMFHSNLGLPAVELPPWAKSPEHFVRMHRLALESELVSCQLHQWIDLIFGYKQRGPEAVSAINTFYYLTYQGNVNLNMIQEPALREAIETQIKHFGQTPSQLTTEPHPPRYSALHVSPSVFSPTSLDELSKVVKFPFNHAIVHIAAYADMSVRKLASLAGHSPGTMANPANDPSVYNLLTITSNNQYQVHTWTKPTSSDQHTSSGPVSGLSSGSSSSSSSQPIFAMDPQLDGTQRRALIDVDDLCSGITLRLPSPSTNRDGKPRPNRVREVAWPNSHFVVTFDGRFIIMGSFYDNSFRVFATSNGKLCQVIYGHRAPITCMARSEGNANADFSLATGSQDCSLLLWSWNERYAQVEGSGVSSVHNPLPKLSIAGHRTPVLSAMICAELGIILSGSKNLILVNTITNGENLLYIDVSVPKLLEQSTRTFEAILKSTTTNQSDHEQATENRQHNLMKPHVENKEKTLLEASMMGDSRRILSPAKQATENDHDETQRRSSPCAQMLASKVQKFSHLRDLCHSDYYITNIKLAREMGFIVVLALPPPREKRSSQIDDDDETNSTSASSSLLMTFNLQGQLMECSTIGQQAMNPRLGDTSLLQTTRDGEHLIVNDSPSSLKVIRTFDLQPVYAFNTNDISLVQKKAANGATVTGNTSNSNNNNKNNNTVTDLDSLGSQNNRVRSLLILDHRYLVVGLENGKLVIYNADFKSFSP